MIFSPPKNDWRRHAETMVETMVDFWGIWDGTGGVFFVGRFEFGGPRVHGKFTLKLLFLSGNKNVPFCGLLA